MRITSGACAVASAIPSAASRGLERPQPGGAQHVAMRASGSSRCRRRSGRAASPAYPLVPCRSGSCSPRTTTSSARASGACSRRVPDLEVAAVCGDLDSLLAAVDAERPDVVVTDIRMPPGDADEGIQAAERLRETNPEIGVVVLSQYATPSYALALLEQRQRAARLPAEGARERPRATRGRDPRRRRRRLGDRPEGRRGAGRGERPRRGVAAQPADPARTRRVARDGRGQEQRRDRGGARPDRDDRSRR